MGAGIAELQRIAVLEADAKALRERVASLEARVFMLTQASVELIAENQKRADVPVKRGPGRPRNADRVMT